MNFWELVSLGGAVFGALSSALAQLASGQPVQLPEVRTYVGGRHIALDIKVTPLG